MDEMMSFLKFALNYSVTNRSRKVEKEERDKDEISMAVYS